MGLVSKALVGVVLSRMRLKLNIGFSLFISMLFIRGPTDYFFRVYQNGGYAGLFDTCEWMIDK